MSKKKFEKEMQMIQMLHAMVQQLPSSSTGVNETDSTEQGSDLGTLKKKMKESSRVSAQKIENAEHNEMLLKYEMQLQRERNKELSKRVGRLEKQVEKMQSKMDEYADMESRINKEIDKKTNRIPKIRRKLSKQGKAIKQMKGLFLSAAIEKGTILSGTSFSQMMKIIAKKKKRRILGLLDNKQWGGQHV